MPDNSERDANSTPRNELPGVLGSESTGRPWGAIRRFATAASWALPLFTVLFTVSGLAGCWFSSRQITTQIDAELHRDAAAMRKELPFTGHWDLTSYRRSDPHVAQWMIEARDGTVIDVDGFIPGIFGSVQAVPAFYDHPSTLQSNLGETWRIFSRRVSGGTVVVGVQDPGNLNAADTLLLASSAAFGDNLDQARHTRPNRIDWKVETALITSTGQLESMLGGIPIATATPEALTPASFNRRINGASYRVRREPIVSPRGEPAGLVFVYRDMAPFRASLRTQGIFNAVVAGMLWIITITVLAKRELSRGRRRRTLKEALAFGEGDQIEFKSGFQVSDEGSARNDFMRRAVTKTVAGFLNASGGELFIGVRDDGTVIGIERELQFAGSMDRFQLALGSALASRIGAAHMGFWRIGFEDYQGLTVCVVSVERSPEPAFVNAEKGAEFFVRSAARTIPLDPRDTVRHLQSRGQARFWFKRPGSGPTQARSFPEIAD